MIRLLASTLVLLCLASSAGADAIYYVGNSLTWDAGPIGRIDALAGERGHAITTGHHICCGATLDFIWNNPTNVCVASPSPFGMHGTALPNFAWDAVTLQPFHDTLAGPAGAISRVRDFMGATQGSPQFYVYSAWPGGTLQPTFDYSALWERPASTGGTFTREWFELAMADLSSDGVLMIPVGDVLYEIDQRAKAGEMPGLSSAEDLYRDDLHLNNRGGYVASLTAYSTMFSDAPYGLTAPGTDISPELAMAIQDAVWDVVSTHPFTGVPEPTAIMPLCLGLLALRRRR